MYVYAYDTLQCKIPKSQRLQKAWVGRSSLKTLLTISIDYNFIDVTFSSNTKVISTEYMRAVSDNQTMCNRFRAKRNICDNSHIPQFTSLSTVLSFYESTPKWKEQDFKISRKSSEIRWGRCSLSPKMCCSRDASINDG